MLNPIAHIRTKYILLLVGIFLFSAISMPARADSPVLHGTISAGSLGDVISSSYSTSATIGTTATLNMPFSVSDLTGSGSGWSLTITSTPFATAGNTHTLSTTASTITSLTAVCTTAGTCSPATLTNNVTLPVAIPAGSTPPPANKFFGTATNTGMGVYTLTPTISIVIPTGTLIGNYATTFTVTIASGP